ncbi:sugar porter family MFS transporter [Aneurinibacillus sp. Ricciae_BoGa-3]|uniref:sugar porter family MFS transporter n=1 Tax=Aneurinibacillus sp. Ricciae_BoGa-3 TaxID=3022697 RepID=UPI002340A3E4|nr:sugar porter family MFS transporter [Aneurinibacillus sp. Ricciae_BoGa-3]WCK52332.1 sugar porter family MFS transporter [Aneurinibacillus sp. Ricciae_BoGa-3]
MVKGTEYEERGSIGFVSLIATVAAVGGLLFGYDTAVISGAIRFIQLKFTLGNFMVGWAVACLIIGATIGTGFAGKISDLYGRKKALILAAILFTLGSVFSGLATNFTWFVIARIIGGLGIGISSVQSPLYIAEIAPAKIRGRLVSLNQLAVVTGIFAVYFLDLGIASRGNLVWNVSTGWRWMLGFGVLPGVLFFILLLLVPESPRWLQLKGREQEAFNILKRIHGESQAQIELKTIKPSSNNGYGLLKQLFKPGLRHALLIGVVLAVLQQVTGINAIMYYAPEIFKHTGAGQNSSLVETVWVGIINLIFTIVSLWLIDKLGRKFLLLAGTAMMTISLLVIGYAFHAGTAGSWVLIFILLYVASFAVSMGPIVWLVIAEIFPNRVRGTASSIASVALWLADYVVSQTFPVLLNSVGVALTFWIFGILSAFAFFFTLKAVPETKGKSLEEIEHMWSRS